MRFFDLKGKTGSKSGNCGRGNGGSMIYTMKGDEIAANEMRNLAHELRTPLTSILGFAELLLEDDSVTGKQREYLEIILGESIKLSGMISARVAAADVNR